jgi:hypothetical protein
MGLQRITEPQVLENLTVITPISSNTYYLDGTDKFINITVNNLPYLIKLENQ